MACALVAHLEELAVAPAHLDAIDGDAFPLVAGNSLEHLLERAGWSRRPIAASHVADEEVPEGLGPYPRGCVVWLDAGELSRIRSLFDTEEQRKKAADEYFDEVFGDHFRAMKAENEEKLAKTRKIANVFRYVCPSNYIPGKQDWGAF